jgi:hypothetical protein
MNRPAKPRTAPTLVSVALLAATLTAVGGPAEARAHRHWHHDDRGYARYGDCSYGSALPLPPVIYPAADWGPFFHRVRHYGPVLYLPPSTCAVVAIPATLRPAVSVLD